MSTLSGVVGVEEGDDEVDEDGQVEGNGSPQGHPPGEPVEHRHACNTQPTHNHVSPQPNRERLVCLRCASALSPLTAQLLLPLHLAVQEGGLLEEVRDL